MLSIKSRKSVQNLRALEEMYDRDENGALAEEAWTRVMAAEELTPMYKGIVAPRLEYVASGDVRFGYPAIDDEQVIESQDWTGDRTMAERQVYVDATFEYRLLLHLDRDSDQFGRQFEAVRGIDRMGLGMYLLEVLVDDEGDWEFYERGLRFERYTVLDHVCGEALETDFELTAKQRAAAGISDW